MKKLPFVTGILIGAAIVAIVWSYFWLKEVIRGPQLATCLLTVEFHLKTAVSSAQSKDEVFLSNNWQALTEKEELAVLSKLTDGAFGECSSFPYIKEGKNEYSEPYLILARRNGEEVDAKIASFRPGSFAEIDKWTK